MYQVFHFAGRPVFAAPAASAQVRLAGILRYQGFTLKRTAYRSLMAASIVLRLDRLFSRPADDPVARPGTFDLKSWLRVLSPLLCERDPAVVFFWPPQCERQRLYAHIFSEAGKAIGFAKIAFDADNADALAREACALAALRGQGLRTCRVPRVIEHCHAKGFAYLVLEVLPERGRGGSPIHGGAYPAELVAEYREPTYCVGRRVLDRLAWWRHFERIACAGQGHFLDRLSSLPDHGVRIGRVHGDLGLHNMLQADDATWVFDWEHSRPDGPLLADELGFHLAQKLSQWQRDPGAYLRWFRRRFIAGATPGRIACVMTALAYRRVAGMDDADLLIRNWAAVEAEERS